MKYVIPFLMTALILQLNSCRKTVMEWRPDTQFPLMEKNGAISSSQSFSLSGVSGDIDIVVINFFAPGCQPCITELPELNKLNEALKSKQNVKFYAIGSSLNSIKNPMPPSLKNIAAEVKTFHDFYKIEYKVYLAESQKLEQFGITGFPETMIFYRSKNGSWYIKRRYVSSITVDNVLDYVNM